MNYFLTCAPTYNPIFKISYYPIWCTLFRLLKEKNIDVIFFKVKAHADNHFNNEVDRLAKEISPPIALVQTKLGFNYTLNYHNQIILTPLRQFVKDLLNSVDFHNIQLLPHFEKYAALEVD